MVNLKSKLDTILGDIPSIKTADTTEDCYQFWQDLPDEVDIFLTEKNYSECISLIQKMKELPPEYHDIRQQFDLEISKVAEAIADELMKSQTTSQA